MNKENKFIVLDIETTGLNPKENEITEISAIKVIDGKIVDQFSTLVSIKGELPEFISRKTHITSDMLLNQPNIEQVMNEFNNFIQDFTLIGHNIKSFDLPFLNYHSIISIGKEITNEAIDTLALAREKLSLSRNKLGNVCSYFGIEYSEEQNHRAMQDVLCTWMVYQELGNIKSTKSKEQYSYHFDKPYTFENKPKLISLNEKSDKLAQFNIVLTGDMPYSRESIIQVIKQNGGIVQNNVILSTSYLVVGQMNNAPTTKYKKAKSLNKIIISFDTFLTFLKEQKILK
ncbi:3'-5' exonuclease [Mycoplasmopsis verecunda]|uniref:DNA polymerase-3 subunit epsilon n=1 Tax=Mycoplasmopsis verecunda TaxID=171291 RepID=A0A1T4LRM4_9BACT|nr:3'-5' exonuclease [Mycoplasmopsis verecunda]WPB54587.1 exonuclease domain-containing protein [Mycoplasmopsis verecunda]SJZ57297.1 DNA polymerase-3 subunit epsilon [Mycoplasmopsis verecunda]